MTYYWKYSTGYRFQTTNPAHKQVLRRYTLAGRGVNNPIEIYDVPASAMKTNCLSEIVFASKLLS